MATVRQGKIELLESAELPEGTRVLVTLLPDDETEFWLQASQTSLDAVWITLRMMSMPNYSKNDIILVQYPFSDLSTSKVRPTVVVSSTRAIALTFPKMRCKIFIAANKVW